LDHQIDLFINFIWIITLIFLSISNDFFKIP